MFGEHLIFQTLKNASVKVRGKISFPLHTKGKNHFIKGDIKENEKVFKNNS